MIKIQMADIDSIRKNPKNPRIIKDDKFKKLVKSVRSFPEMLQIRPIVIDSDKIILGGNMRYEACKSAGLKEIPIIDAAFLNSDQCNEFIIKDNVSGGEWDWAELANEWDAEKLDEWGLDLPVPIMEDDEIIEDDSEEKSGIEQCECPKCGYKWKKNE